MFIRHIENFPIVQISYLAEDAVFVDETLEIFTHLLDKQQKFVFVSRGAFPEQKEQHEDRKKVANWVKQNRDILAKYVKALIHVEPDENIRLVEQKYANNYVRFTGYPMFIVENDGQAEQLIEKFLNSHPV